MTIWKGIVSTSFKGYTDEIHLLSYAVTLLIYSNWNISFTIWDEIPDVEGEKWSSAENDNQNNIVLL